MEKIIGDLHKLMEDGSGAARYYFSEAINSIDTCFGKGYAKDHPELIAAYMKTAVMDNHATVIGKCIQDVATAIELAGSGVASQLHDIYNAVG